ncbi:transposase [Streptomyces chartreusis]|uniref:transposase n=1 Tax=Streptomyces chartreusis TaxID=1969 RepID=UPI00367BA226
MRRPLLDRRRKSVEPMATRLGEDGNRQALAHSSPPVRGIRRMCGARLAWRMQDAIGAETLIVNDTDFKKGQGRLRVSRQYTGTSGKVTKCQGGVSLHLARDHASAAVNWRLFLPASWDPASPEADPGKVARRIRCGILTGVGHAEKWQLALDMIDETRSWGIDIPLVVADAGSVMPPPSTWAWRNATCLMRWGFPPAIAPVGPSPGRSSPSMRAPACRRRCSTRTSAQTAKELFTAAGRAAARPVSGRTTRPGSTTSSSAWPSDEGFRSS